MTVGTNVRDPILEGSSIIGLRYFYLLETFHIPFLPRYFLFSFFSPFRNKSLRTKQPNGSSKQAGWKEKIEEKKIRFIFEIRNLRIHALSSVKKREKESTRLVAPPPQGDVNFYRVTRIVHDPKRGLDRWVTSRQHLPVFS